MGSNSTVAKRYVRCVGEALYCSRKTKTQILSQISESVEDYLLQHPEADFEMLQTRFGTPKQIAASCVDEQDALALFHKVRIKKKVLALVAGVMAAIFLMWIGLVSWETIDARDAKRGCIEATTVMD